jgi:hypothetical protein
LLNHSSQIYALQGVERPEVLRWLLRSQIQADHVFHDYRSIVIVMVLAIGASHHVVEEFPKRNTGV